MDKFMFSRDFPNMACSVHHEAKSRNNNNRPNKKNDVITDLGGEGYFPMFLYDGSVFTISPSYPSTNGNHRTPELLQIPRKPTSVDPRIVREDTAVLSCLTYKRIKHGEFQHRV